MMTTAREPFKDSLFDFRRWAPIFIVLAFFGVTKAANANIFGEDTRHPQSRENAGRIYAPIMRIQLNNAIPMEPTPYADFVSGKAKLFSKAMATGFMVSPCYMLTNYHAVFGKLGGIDSSNIGNFTVTVYPQDGAPILARPELKGKADDSGARINSNDWALLRLDQCIGEKIGWMERGDIDTAAEHGFTYYIAGFPGDLAGVNPRADLVMSGGCALRVPMTIKFYQDSNGKIISDSSGRFKSSFTDVPIDDRVRSYYGEIHHDCPMTSGASGAPIFYIDQNGVPRYVAINAADSEGRLTPYEKWTSETSNYAAGLGCTFPKNRGGLEWAEMWRRIDADQKRLGNLNPALKGFPAEVFTDPQGVIPAKLLKDPRL
jgi:hypothetical protein